MKVLALALSVLGLTSVSASISNQDGPPANLTMKYAFEIVRHGARAPMIPDPGFKNESFQQLTPTGMRQRFLLGRHTYQEYSGSIGGDELVKQGIEVLSTNVYRTIQSGYSELMGMIYAHNVNNTLMLTQKQFEDLQSGVRGMPPMMIRRNATINTDLQRNAAPNGFVSIPIHTGMSDSYYGNDIGYTSCHYASNVVGVRRSNDTAFDSILYTQKNLAPYFYDSFKDKTNLTQNDFNNMKFNDFQSYTDTIVSEKFEGIQQVVNWTDEQNKEITLEMDAVLVDIYTKRARMLGITHEMRGVVKDLKQWFFGNGTSTKYRIYSAHDSNIAAWLNQFVPNYVWNGIPYAANIHIELWQAPDMSNWVQFVYNGVPLQLEQCKSIICSQDEFMMQIITHLWQGDLEEACDQDPKHFYDSTKKGIAAQRARSEGFLQ